MRACTRWPSSAASFASVSASAESPLEECHGRAEDGGHPEEEGPPRSLRLLLEHRQHVIEAGAVAVLGEIVGAEDEGTELRVTAARLRAEDLLGSGEALGQRVGTEQADQSTLEDEREDCRIVQPARDSGSLVGERAAALLRARLQAESGSEAHHEPRAQRIGLGRQ